MAIVGCKDKRTERFLAGERVKEFEGFARAATKALGKLQAAVVLGDLWILPSNHAKAIGGGEYSIRINDQYRVRFKWAPHGAVELGSELLAAGDSYDVEINDFH